jgi:DNA-binding NarL/FixJ family response regulator
MASKIRIGLLDTDSDVRLGRKLVLSSQPKFEVVFDSDGSTEDLEAIEQSLIDVLVIDQKLSSGAGVSFYASLRNLTGVKQAPPALLTASFAQPELLLDALQEGFVDLLTVEQGASGLVAAVSRASSGANTHSLSTIWELISLQPSYRAVDLNFVRLLDELPQRLASILKKLKTVWQSSDSAKIEQFELSSLNTLVARLPVSNSVELILAMNRSGLLDVE